MLKPRKITLRNWQRVRAAEVEFPDSGLVLVLGDNRAAGGNTRSIGAGKSSLGEALARALLGVDGKYAQLGWHSTDEGGDTYVRVEADLNGQALVVELGYKCTELSATGEGLRFQLGNADPIERAHVKDTRRELAAAIGVPPELAGWSSYLDGERLKFNRLSQEASVELLMQALRQPPWNQLQARALAGSSALGAERDRLAMQLAQFKSNAEEAKDAVTRADISVTLAERALSEAKEALKDKVVMVKEVQRLEGEQKALVRRLREATEADPEAFKALEHQRLEAMSQRRQAGTAADQWARAQRERERAQLACAQVLADLKAPPSKCPRCGQGIKARVIPATELELATKGAQEAQAALAEAQEAVEGWEQARQEAAAAEAQAMQAQQALTADGVKKMGCELQELEAALASARSLLAELEEADQTVALAQALAVARSRWSERLLAHQLAAKVEAELSVKAREATRAAALAAYWSKGFGPTGVPNLALSLAMLPLNLAAEEASQRLTGGVVSVSFEATTELKSGEAKAQLVTRPVAEHGASRLQGYSKGEGGLVNLVIAEAQTAVGGVLGRVGFRWVDEAVNSQDPLVRQRVYAYLKQQALDLNLLTFVVDHNREAEAAATHTLWAVKDAEGDTTFKWA